MEKEKRPKATRVKARYCITIDEDLFDEIDAYCLEHQYRYRSHGVANLVRLGLARAAELEGKKK